MRKVLVGIALLVVGAGVAAAKLIPGDSKRGSELIHRLGCMTCHSVRGEGGSSAPDLGSILGRNFTPSSMASSMWNHAPAMWGAMGKQGIAAPRLSGPQAADLFAYFHSVRFFEMPGDAARGKRVFESARCAECHGLSSPIVGGAAPVASWRSLVAPIVLAQEMWNHAPQMEGPMASRKIKWPRLTSQELTDLLVYLRNQPATRGRVGDFSLTATGQGESLFQNKGCRNCHQGKLALENRLVPGTMTDFAVAMWNHGPVMSAYGRRMGQPPPQLDAEEMREIVAYLWYARIFAEAGSPTRGQRVFERKNCSACHNDPASGAPDLKQRLLSSSDPVRAFSMVSVLWQHGPAMLDRMKVKGTAWPHFSESEMVDLISYLNSLGSRTLRQDK